MSCGPGPRPSLPKWVDSGSRQPDLFQLKGGEKPLQCGIRLSQHPISIGPYKENERPSAMFAVISDGNRQYRVEQGDTVLVDFRLGAEIGHALRFEQVLLANGGGSSAIGTPAISGALVEATVVDPEVKGKKLEIGKFRRRKNSRRHTGHRQKYTSVKITTITVPGLEIVEKSAEEKQVEKKRREEARRKEGAREEGRVSPSETRRPQRASTA